MIKDEALKMAIEVFDMYGNKMNSAFADEVYQACKEALEQPAQGLVESIIGKQRWQGLSDEERNKIWSNIEAEENTEMYFGGKLALAIEAKLRERNT